MFSNDYGAVTDAGYQLPRIPIEKVPRKYHRQKVRYDTTEKPGTIIVDTQNKFLYFVDGGRQGDALRHRRRPRGLRVARHRPHRAEARMADLDAAVAR